MLTQQDLQVPVFARLEPLTALQVQDPWRLPGDLAAPALVSAAGRDAVPPESRRDCVFVSTESRLCVGPADGGTSDLLQELDSLPLLLLPQTLPPLSLLEALTEGVGVVKVDLQVEETINKLTSGSVVVM